MQGQGSGSEIVRAVVSGTTSVSVEVFASNLSQTVKLQPPSYVPVASWLILLELDSEMRFNIVKQLPMRMRPAYVQLPFLFLLNCIADVCVLMYQLRKRVICLNIWFVKSSS